LLDTITEAGARADWRLRDEEVAWLTTVRSDGQPQSGPIWSLWDGQAFLIYSQQGRQKLKNIGRTPRVGLNLNPDAHGGAVVRTEGIAEIVEDFLPATEVGEYLEEYRAAIARIGCDPDGFAQDYSVSIRVTPERWQVW
jgi:PPOX class probable F420-dependent enzyme